MLEGSCNCMFRQSSAFRTYVRAEAEAPAANGIRDPTSGLKGEPQWDSQSSLSTLREGNLEWKSKAALVYFYFIH